MFIQHRSMWRLLLAALVATSCSSVPNPRSCEDGTCTSEEFPFCDVNGTFGEEPGTCIAVTCEPNTFAQCRDDRAVTCNATGNDYDLLDCSLGCQEGIGCRTCQPNETVCTNGGVQTCDSSGNVTSNEPCALGCFDSQPRCRDISPSNGFAQYLDNISTPMDVAFETATINTTTGEINTPDGPLVVPSFLAPAPPGGVPVRVFVVRDADIGNVSVLRTVSVGDGFAPALAFVGTGDFVVSGGIGLSDTYAMAPGAYSSPSCDGKPGIRTVYGNTGSEQYGGGSGGGHATDGAPGGAVTGGAEGTVIAARSGGTASGNPELVPLRGGCASGDQITGGGAIQFSTRGSIRILGTIYAAGGDWPEQEQQFGVDGGGGGGGILLEAASVELGPVAKLIAYGGGGSAWQVVATDATDHAQPPTGGQCGSLPHCGNGGNGGGPLGPPTAGANVEWVNLTTVSSGGGGGGTGRIRINTRDGTYVKASSAIEGGVGVVTTGLVKTR